MNSNILIVARNTFREAVRDRVLYNLIVFVLLITVAAVFLGELTAGQQARTIVNLGLTAVLLFGTFIAIFVGVSLVSKEIEKRTVYSILSKPIKRSSFLTGKYLGLCLTIFINIVVMGVGISVALLSVDASNLVPSVWTTLILIYLELTIIIAVAVLFSSFSSPTLAAILTFLIFLIGNFSSSLRDLAQSLGSSGAKIFFNTIYYLLPNLNLYNFTTNAAHGDIVSVSYTLYAASYAVIYNCVLIAAAVFIFNRRNHR